MRHCFTWSSALPADPGLQVIEEPTGHLFSIETCRQQLELVAIDVDTDGNTSHPDDSLILRKLDTAVEVAEDFTGLSIAIRTYRMALDAWPTRDRGAIRIPRPPLIEVVNFIAGDSDTDGVPADAYIIDPFRWPNLLRPVDGWPSLNTTLPNAIQVTYRAGYSSEGVPDSDARRLPSVIGDAILLLMTHLYEHRSDSVEKALSSIPSGFEALLRPRRILFGFA